MVFFFPALLLVAALLSWPAFRLSKRRAVESRGILFLSAPALVVWIVLAGAGYGAQSLSNLVEVPWLVGAGILLSYLKVLLLDRWLPSPRATTAALMVLLAVLALLLRSLMPVLPE